MMFSMRMRTLEDGSILVAPIDPDTREETGPFRQPTDEERRFINGYLGRETRTIAQMIADPKTTKIHFSDDRDSEAE